MRPAIRIKRAYEPPSKEDGLRILVDGLWPRGLKKEALKVHEWVKAIAPSAGLRKWFGHVVGNWKGFQRKYRAELKDNPAVKDLLEKYGHHSVITLVYSAKDEQHNQAVVLRDYLEEQVADR